MTSDEAIVDQVRHYYNGNTANAPSGVFTYWKKGKWHTKTKAVRVVSVWRELLAKDEELAQSWEAWEADNEG
jgi:hypothetical protein